MLGTETSQKAYESKALSPDCKIIDSIGGWI